MERIITKIAPPATKQAPKRKRVAAYARVSSGREAPLHSLSAQVSHYSDLIQKTPGWEYAGVYADEALSGTKDSRGEFQRLLAACHAGDIDLVLTKSVSRFARNVVTTLKTIRELRLIGVDVFFEEQNIHTLGEEGELLLTLLAAYAEEEARSVSENQKWRIKSNYEQGLPWSITMFGYKQVDGRLEIVPEEAELLRLAADLYLEGYGRYKLEDAFAEAGIKGRHGAALSGHCIIDLLCNEKIVGDMLLQKTFVEDPITKVVRPNNGEKPQYLVEGSHEPILDRETYEKVLAERARRASYYKPRSGGYERNRFSFSSKVRCGKCGKYFTRKVLNGNSPYEKRGWICRTFNQKGKARCDAKQIPEDILERVSAEAMGLPEFDAAVFAANEGEVSQYYVANSHPAIIELEVFDLVQYEMKRRKEDGRFTSCTHPFSGKIVCGHCGGFYGSKGWHSNTPNRALVWQCNEKHRGQHCKTPHFAEADIQAAFLAAFNIVLGSRDEIMEAYNEVMEALTDTADLDAERD